MGRKKLIPFILVLLIPNKAALKSKIYFKNTLSKALFRLSVFFPLYERYNIAALHHATFMRNIVNLRWLPSYRLS